ncbi:MAG: hypothetical protein ACRDRL_11005 [Sciscionella sp.]
MRHVRLAALATLVIAAAAACSHDRSTPAPRSTITTGNAAPPSFAAQALAAYEAMWTAVQLASVTSNYTDPRLGDHLAGQAYTTISENMAVNKANGIIGLGQPVLHPRVISSNASTVTLADCMDDTHWLQYHAATHTLVDNLPGGHRYSTATVTNQNGTWKVTVIDTRADGSCT